MKVVIDIPEEMRTSLELGSFGAKYSMYDLAGCVMHGTPLPKGHEYIDRSNAITSICQWFTTAERCGQFSFTTNLVKQIVVDILCDEPTIIDKEEQG